eukprot:197151-Amphidinium_carterae.1
MESGSDALEGRSCRSSSGDRCYHDMACGGVVLWLGVWLTLWIQHNIMVVVPRRVDLDIHPGAEH